MKFYRLKEFQFFFAVQVRVRNAIRSKALTNLIWAVTTLKVRVLSIVSMNSLIYNYIYIFLPQLIVE